MLRFKGADADWDTLPRMLLWFKWLSPVAAAGRQAVRARREVLGFFSRSFTCSGSLQRDVQRANFWRNKRRKSDESLFSLLKLFYRVEKNLETNIFKKTQRALTLKDETAADQKTCRRVTTGRSC